MNVYTATKKLNHDPRKPNPKCDCLNCKPSRDTLEQQLRDTQHELALLEDRYKLYPGAWCCKGAEFSGGWYHDIACSNWAPCP